MQIEAGKKYVTRSGVVVGPMLQVAESGYKWSNNRADAPAEFCWHDDGKWLRSLGSPEDLVAEYTDEPNRERRIVEGRYYVTNSGHTVGPMEYDETYQGEYALFRPKNNKRVWWRDGRLVGFEFDDPWSINFDVTHSVPVEPKTEFQIPADMKPFTDAIEMPTGKFFDVPEPMIVQGNVVGYKQEIEKLTAENTKLRADLALALADAGRWQSRNLALENRLKIIRTACE